MNMNELVSCVIPSYKRCDTVTRAIDSVLSQTYKNIEVCLVDDNIPGDEYSIKLKETVNKYKGDSRIRYIAQDKHINGAAARNAGIRAAKGKYIAFLDDDDEWLPEKIEKQMGEIQADSKLDGVTVLWALYVNNKLIRKSRIYTADNLQFKVFNREVAIFTSTVLMKKKAIERFGGFDEKLVRHQDLQFLIDALAMSKFYVIPDYLVKLHGDSEINHPNLERMIMIKKNFFKSVEGELIKYNASEQKRIKNAHCFEIAFSALKAKEYLIALQYTLKTEFNIVSLQDLWKRYRAR